MPVVDLGDGITVDVPLPSRADYPNNLGGAVAHTLQTAFTNLFMRICVLLANIVVAGFMKLSGLNKPHSLAATQNAKNSLLANPNVPSWAKQVIQALDSASPVVSFITSLLLVGVVMKSWAEGHEGVFVKGMVNELNKQYRPEIPDVGYLIRAWRLRVIDGETFSDALKKLGYNDTYINAIMAASTDIGTIEEWVKAYRRGNISPQALNDAAARLGVTADALNVMLRNEDRLLDTVELFQAYYRGVLGSTELTNKLRQLNYTDSDINTLWQIMRPIPGPSDLVRMAVREAFRDDVAQRWGYDADFPPFFAEWMQKHGYEPQWAKYYWRAHWELPSVTLGRELVYRGAITPAEFEELLRLADYPAGWRNRIMRALYEPLTRVDVRRMYRLGVLSREEVKKAYKALGYDDNNAELLTRFTEKYEAPDPDFTVDQYNDAIAREVQKLYRKGVITQAEARGWLRSLRKSDEEIALILQLVETQRMVDLYPDITADYRREIESVVRKLYRDRAIDAATAKNYLTRAGITEQEANYTIAALDMQIEYDDLNATIQLIEKAYLSGAVDDSKAVELLGKLAIPAAQQNRLLGNWANARLIRDRRLSESQYRTAWKLGLINEDEYKRCLADLGYCDKDIELLVQMVKHERAEEIAEKPKLLSESVYRAAFKQGIITEDYYRARLADMGYQADDIDLLAEMAKPRETVAQLSAAFKQGDITEAQLRERLKAAGYSQEHINLIVAVAQPEPPIDALNKALKAGVISVDEYRTRLQLRGYKAADIDMMVRTYSAR